MSNKDLTNREFVDFMLDPDNSMASQTSLTGANEQVFDIIYEDILDTHGFVAQDHAIDAFEEYNAMTLEKFKDVFGDFYAELKNITSMDSLMRFIAIEDDFSFVGVTQDKKTLVFTCPCPE